MKTKVALLSAGLGHVARGFETSAAEWFQAIKNDPRLEVRLFSGGDYEQAVPVFNFHRDGAIAAALRRLHVIHDGCRLEQLSFSVGLLSELFRFKPDVIWVQETNLGLMLLKFRKWFGFKYKLMFCDGAPIGHQFADQFDYIVFLHQYALEDALRDGVDRAKCAVVPYLSFLPAKNVSRAEARKRLGIETDKTVIISAAAWNTHHKRIDYLLHEVAGLEPGKFKLLLCGQPEKETEQLKELATQLKLDTEWRTLKQEDLSIAYFSADIFVLASLKEGLPAVLIEAGAHGLPVLCHPHPAGKYIFEEEYPWLTDMSVPGNLCNQLKRLSASDITAEGAKTSAIIRAKFDRRVLVSRFIDFLQLAGRS